MSDPANQGQSPPPPAASQTLPSSSGTSSATEVTGGTPDGREHTALTQTDAPASTESGKEATKETETKAATPFDAAKLNFPENLGKPDEGMLNEFSEIAKSANLSQETAQQIADLHVKAVSAASEENRKAWTRTIDSWENEIKADPVIGGDKWDGIKANIAKIFHDPRFATPGFIEALDLTGAGSNPAIARFFDKVAKVLTEGSAVAGSPPGQTQPRTMAQAIYPNNPSEAR